MSTGIHVSWGMHAQRSVCGQVYTHENEDLCTHKGNSEDRCTYNCESEDIYTKVRVETGIQKV